MLQSSMVLNESLRYDPEHTDLNSDLQFILKGNARNEQSSVPKKQAGTILRSLSIHLKHGT